jgi:hypothetical protein
MTNEQVTAETEAHLTRAFDATEASTALRLYLILACCVARGESVTIDALTQRAKKTELAALAAPLTQVAAWCRSNRLPALTSIVLETRTGSPPLDFKAVEWAQIPDEQERVWGFDWYTIMPPALTELTSNAAQR